MTSKSGTALPDINQYCIIGMLYNTREEQIPVSTLSKAEVCSGFIAGVAGSNPADRVDVRPV